MLFSRGGWLVLSHILIVMAVISLLRECCLGMQLDTCGRSMEWTGYLWEFTTI